MGTTTVFITRHPLPTYFAVTFAISWGGFLLVVGPGGFASTSWQTDARFPLAIVAMLAGPSLTGVLLTTLVDGRAGLREVLRRLLRWRVSAGWYAMALLPAPLLAAAVLFALSLSSPIFTTANKNASLTASTIFIFTPLATGVSFLSYVWVLAAALWVVVLVVACGGQLSRQQLRRRA